MSRYVPSSSQLYLVRWKRPQDRLANQYETRMFRLRQPAIECMLTLEREGREVSMYVARMPEWHRTTPTHDETLRAEDAVERRLDRRRTAREVWAAA